MSAAILNWLKPRRSEAVARIRSNGLGLLVLFVVTNLLPFPSLWTAISLVWGNKYVDYENVGGSWWRGLCMLELVLMGVMGMNVLQASYALQYPPPSFPPAPTSANSMPATPKSPPQRRLAAFTPTQSPHQPQKAFSSSLYASSPISTPSRTLRYSIPNSTPVDSSFASSTSSFPGSPSPAYNSPLAAYRGKHKTGAGRAFDGELLTRLTQSTAEDDDE